MTGTAFAVVGPSGAGKDTLMEAAARARPDLALIRRVITRPEAAGGEDFEGISVAAFVERRAAGAFAMDWQAHGLRYGIPAEVLLELRKGRDVMFNGSRAALPAAQACFERLVVVLVTAPVSILAQRLAARGRESAADIAKRLARAPFDLPEGIDLRVVQNDGSLEAGVSRFLLALQPVTAPS
jgi:ribose 1,5-bisphosphokinase